MLKKKINPNDDYIIPNRYLVWNEMIKGNKVKTSKIDFSLVGLLGKVDGYHSISSRGVKSPLE